MLSILITTRSDEMADDQGVVHALKSRTSFQKLISKFEILMQKFEIVLVEIHQRAPCTDA